MQANPELMIPSFETIVSKIKLSGGSLVILVSFFPDHRIGRSSPGIFKHCRGSRRDRETSVRGIPGLVSRLPRNWTTSHVGPVNVRVAPVLTVRVWNQKAPLESR